MFTQDFTDNLAKQVIESAEKQLKSKMLNETLSRMEAIKMIGTSETTFNEIRKREDFKFVVVEGVPGRYSTANLIKWINNERGGKK